MWTKPRDLFRFCCKSVRLSLLIYIHYYFFFFFLFAIYCTIVKYMRRFSLCNASSHTQSHIFVCSIFSYFTHRLLCHRQRVDTSIACLCHRWCYFKRKKSQQFFFFYYCTAEWVRTTIHTHTHTVAIFTSAENFVWEKKKEENFIWNSSLEYFNLKEKSISSSKLLFHFPPEIQRFAEFHHNFMSFFFWVFN